MNVIQLILTPYLQVSWSLNQSNHSIKKKHHPASAFSSDLGDVLLLWIKSVELIFCVMLWWNLKHSPPWSIWQQPHSVWPFSLKVSAADWTSPSSSLQRQSETNHRVSRITESMRNTDKVRRQWERERERCETSLASFLSCLPTTYIATRFQNIFTKPKDTNLTEKPECKKQ